MLSVSIERLQSAMRDTILAGLSPVTSVRWEMSEVTNYGGSVYAEANDRPTGDPVLRPAMTRSGEAHARACFDTRSGLHRTCIRIGQGNDCC